MSWRKKHLQPNVTQLYEFILDQSFGHVRNDRAQIPMGPDFRPGGLAHKRIAVDMIMMFMGVQNYADRPTVLVGQG